MPQTTNNRISGKQVNTAIKFLHASMSRTLIQGVWRAVTEGVELSGPTVDAMATLDQAMRESDHTAQVSIDGKSAPLGLFVDGLLYNGRVHAQAARATSKAVWEGIGK